MTTRRIARIGLIFAARPRAASPRGRRPSQDPASARKNSRSGRPRARSERYRNLLGRGPERLPPPEREAVVSGGSVRRHRRSSSSRYIRREPYRARHRAGEPAERSHPWQRAPRGSLPGNRAAFSGAPAFRPRASCGPWRGGVPAPGDPTASPCVRENHDAAYGRDWRAETCASWKSTLGSMQTNRGRDRPPRPSKTRGPSGHVRRRT